MCAACGRSSIVLPRLDAAAQGRPVSRVSPPAVTAPCAPHRQVLRDIEHAVRHRAPAARASSDPLPPPPTGAVSRLHRLGVALWAGVPNADLHPHVTHTHPHPNTASSNARHQERKTRGRQCEHGIRSAPRDDRAPRREHSRGRTPCHRAPRRTVAPSRTARRSPQPAQVAAHSTRTCPASWPSSAPIPGAVGRRGGVERQRLLAGQDLLDILPEPLLREVRGPELALPLVLI